MSDFSSIILDLFHTTKANFLSGEHISCELKITRSAVWKQINQLRRLGYIIEAVPSKGYRLFSAPDIISSANMEPFLKTEVIGKNIICHQKTASTNADAFRIAEEGAREGTTVIADCQEKGKGRLGRVWTSPPAVNLYCSIILRPLIMPYQAPQLTFLSAVAVARAIEITTNLKPQIKWPNDILIDGCKIAGLLNEMSAETDLINFVILGIGVNINMTREQFPKDLRNPATSLFIEQQKTVSRVEFCATMLNELELLYAEFHKNGFEPVRKEWQKRSIATGRAIAVSDGDLERVRGECVGIDEDGALLLRKPDDGSIVQIHSGDVRII